MGGVTAIFYMAEHPGVVKCAVLDSAFSSLNSVFDSMAGQMGIPPEFAQMIIPMLDQELKTQHGFNIADLEVEPAAKQCDAPALFIHGGQDDFIVPDHSVTNMTNYKGSDKTIEIVEGDHNSERPAGCIIKINLFLKQHLL